MRTLRLVTTGFAALAMAASLAAPGAARSGAATSDETTKQLDAKHSAQRKTGSIARPKVAGKTETQRVHPALVDAPALQKTGRTAATVEQFRNRAKGVAAGTADFGPGKQKKASNRQPLERVTLPSGKTATRDKVEGAGTGGGDIEEVEPNNTAAQDLVDLPINVVGRISSQADIADCYAIELAAGDPVRIEVVSDRVFNTGLDSYVTVLEDDGSTVVVENDVGFDDSVDSFVRFTASYTGVYFVCVQDALGFGDPSYLYVLNITLADFPDLSEQEFNDDLDSADTLTLPSIVFGDMGASGDLDVYTFVGSAGTTIVVDVDAAIFLSALDSIVGLYDDGGGLLFAYDEDDADPANPDTRFNIVLPYSGRYYLSVGDAFDRGNSAGDYYYSLSLTDQSGALAPRVTGVKLNPSGLAKKVIGSGFDRRDAFAELTADNTIAERLNSFPAPKKPTTAIKLSPAVEVFSGDVFTVVNGDGRRSNPGVLN